MARGFAIQSDTRIDEYDPGHVVDLRADGTLHVLDADGTVARSYTRAGWTVLVLCGGRECPSDSGPEVPVRLSPL